MSDIYILGSGPSVNFIDPSFFHGKEVIAVNSAADRMGIYGMASVTVHTHYHDEGLKLARKYPDRMVWMPNGDRGLDGQPSTLLHNTVYYPHFPTSMDFIPRAKPGGLIVGSTSTHGAMHLACKMGARNVILVGIDCGRIDGKVNVDGYSSGDLTVTDTDLWLARWEQHLRLVKAWLQDQCDVNIYSLNPFLNLNMEGHAWSGTSTT
jgi:hypothetical protein